MAVDISIWLFQVQAGRGGRSPEIRTLFYRLLKFLALPIHPLFVYDGANKPPFKRGKAVSGQRTAPIIHLSKRLVDLFRFPRHDAPGEAEAECANLQRAGVVDAVMSNDVDAMMFGSSMTIMNFSKESGSGTTSASHATCYRMGGEAGPSKVGIDRAGMILFALLSGGDYLPSGVPKCGSKLAAQIAKAGFGADLLGAIGSKGMERTEQLSEWRDRLQYELEENESGYFQNRHKAVRIPDDFPDQTILEYYASPVESNVEELNTLRQRLRNAWDQDIDPLEIKTFAAKYFDWNYRSGARKVVRLLAEPLVNYRLRLQRRPSAFPPDSSSLSNSDIPMLQKVHKARVSYSTDGMTELQVDYIPIDVVGLDIMEEEPNPPLASQETAPSGDEEEDVDGASNLPASTPQSPVKKRVTKRYDPYVPEKMWIFETLANIGIPEVVEAWKKQEAEKNAPKKPRTRKTGPRKKGPIDPGMKRGSILKYGTLTKERTDTSQFKQAHLFEAAISSAPEKSTISGARGLERSPSYTMTGSPSRVLNSSLDNSTTMRGISPPGDDIKRPPVTNRPRTRAQRAVLSGDVGVVNLESDTESHLDVSPTPKTPPRELRITYSNANYEEPSSSNDHPDPKQIMTPPKSTKKGRPRGPKTSKPKVQDIRETEQLQDRKSPLPSLEEETKAIGGRSETLDEPLPAKAPRRRSPRNNTPEELVPEPSEGKTNSRLLSASPSVKEDSPSPAQGKLEPVTKTEKSEKTPKTPKTTRKQRNKTKSPSPKSEEPQDVKGPVTATAKTSPPSPPQEASRYLESITAYDGFWTVDEKPIDEKDNEQSDTKDSSRRSGSRHHNGKHNKDADNKKKRIPRVSILDLT